MTDKTYQEPVPEPFDHDASVGKRLATARAELGWTAEDIADSLNLSLSTIRAIENDEYAKLPGHTFTVGYIRSYAKLLKLEEASLLQSVELQESTAPLPIFSRNTRRVKVRNKPKKRKSGKRFLKVLLILILLMVLMQLVLTQWSKLDMQQVATWLKLPVSVNVGSSGEDGEQISFEESQPEETSRGALITTEE